MTWNSPFWENHHYSWHYINKTRTHMLFYHGHGCAPTTTTTPLLFIISRGTWIDWAQLACSCLSQGLLSSCNHTFVHWSWGHLNGPLGWMSTLSHQCGLQYWDAVCQLGAQLGLLTRAPTRGFIMCLRVLKARTGSEKSTPRAVPKPQVKPVKLLTAELQSSRGITLPYSSTLLNTAQIQSEEK